MHGTARRSPASVLRTFLTGEARGGVVLMIVAALALVVANSALAPAYFGLLKAYGGGLSVLHWINDAPMAVFFLLVGLEIKRELLDGQLSTWPRRVAKMPNTSRPVVLVVSMSPASTFSPTPRSLQCETS